MKSRTLLLLAAVLAQPLAAQAPEFHLGVTPGESGVSGFAELLYPWSDEWSSGLNVSYEGKGTSEKASSYLIAGQSTVLDADLTALTWSPTLGAVDVKLSGGLFGHQRSLTEDGYWVVNLTGLPSPNHILKNSRKDLFVGPQVGLGVSTSGDSFWAEASGSYVPIYAASISQELSIQPLIPQKGTLNTSSTGGNRWGISAQAEAFQLLGLNVAYTVNTLSYQQLLSKVSLNASNVWTGGSFQAADVTIETRTWSAVATVRLQWNGASVVLGLGAEGETTKDLKGAGATQETTKPKFTLEADL